MTQAIVVQAEKQGCCTKDESVKGTCHKPATPPKACHSDNKDDNSCNMPMQTTCVCTCLFQYSAPAPFIIPFGISALDILNTPAGFLPLHYKAPDLPAPWQPPDMI